MMFMGCDIGPGSLWWGCVTLNKKPKSPGSSVFHWVAVMCVMALVFATELESSGIYTSTQMCQCMFVYLCYIAPTRLYIYPCSPLHVCSLSIFRRWLRRIYIFLHIKQRFSSELVDDFEAIFYIWLRNNHSHAWAIFVYTVRFGRRSAPCRTFL